MKDKIEIEDLAKENSVGFFITKTSQYLKFAAINAIKNLNIDDPLTLDQYELLHVLLLKDGLYQRQLGQILLKDRPNTTRLVNILAEKNFVERREDPDNKRKHRIFITKAGREKVFALKPLKVRMVDKVLAGIPEKDLTIMLKTLEKIRENLEDDFTMQT
ncbi:winged helix-turn-helix transcriptional regulator [bacterium]|nr:winged helix-turn-helix transcriptional regulator [bacterium]